MRARCRRICMRRRAIRTKPEPRAHHVTAVTALPAVRQRHGGGGVQTSGMVFGGISPNPGGSYLATAVGYDGTSWAAIPSLAAAKSNIGLSLPGTALLQSSNTTEAFKATAIEVVFIK